MGKRSKGGGKDGGEEDRMTAKERKWGVKMKVAVEGGEEGQQANT